jgi:hypothetical protein
MTFYLVLWDGIIVCSSYTWRNWMHALRIPLGQFQLSGGLSHTQGIDRSPHPMHNQDFPTLSLTRARDEDASHFQVPILL